MTDDDPGEAPITAEPPLAPVTAAMERIERQLQALSGRLTAGPSADTDRRLGELLRRFTRLEDEVAAAHAAVATRAVAAVSETVAASQAQHAQHIGQLADAVATSLSAAARDQATRIGLFDQALGAWTEDVEAAATSAGDLTVAAVDQALQASQAATVAAIADATHALQASQAATVAAMADATHALQASQAATVAVLTEAIEARHASTLTAITQATEAARAAQSATVEAIGEAAQAIQGAATAAAETLMGSLAQAGNDGTTEVARLLRTELVGARLALSAGTRELATDLAATNARRADEFQLAIGAELAQLTAKLAEQLTLLDQRQSVMEEGLRALAETIDRSAPVRDDIRDRVATEMAERLGRLRETAGGVGDAVKAEARRHRGRKPGT